MKKLTLTAVAVAASLAVVAANASWFGHQGTLKTQMEKVSYTIGYQMGQSFKKQNIAAQPKLILAGMKAGFSGKKSTLTEAQMKTTMEAFQKAMVAKMTKKNTALATTNMQASDTFMAKIATEKGVHKITDGLYYKVIKTGTGPKPTATDKVVVNYSGALTTGKVFDSSYKRGKPATFGVNQVIKGWSQALVHMPVGSTWTLYIAPKLAYGKFAPPTIGPNQALVFKVNLISIKKASKAAKTAK